MIASTISEDPLGDFLGISAARPNGKAIVHFDTEQSRMTRTNSSGELCAGRRRSSTAMAPVVLSH